MNELTKGKESAYEQYEKLILQRDQLEKEAESIFRIYVNKFGKLITDSYEMQIECIKIKKMISYCQAAINRGQMIDRDQIMHQVDLEMQEYYAKLDEMLSDNEKCKQLEFSSDYTVRRVKKLYRMIAKKLHPDINPMTDQDETLQELWMRVMIAYHANDLKGMTELVVLVDSALEDAGWEQNRIDIPDIADKIREITAEIYQIRHTEPYMHKYLIENEAKTKEKKKELRAELKQFKAYRDELQETLNQMLLSGGFKFTWQMN